jgi:3-isopropylmalate/(R)-2-methylmalate dehydratase small subunit
MEPLKSIRSRTVVLPLANIDTDQIIPARYLRATTREGFGENLFADWRYEASGSPKPDFVLNKPEAQGCRILAAGRNFGCGSSREAAVYALYDYGVRCVIAPSFGDIFSGNAVQNGLLTAIVTDEEAAEIMAALQRTPDLPVTVDLEQQTIVCGNRTYDFKIDPVRRKRLLNGWDDLALTDSYRDRISAHKANDRARRPWAVPRASR